MEINVENRFCKGSARKIRPLLHLARGKNIEEAEKSFRFMKSYGNEIWKLIKNGVSIVTEKDIEVDKVYIKKISCEKSKELKRHRFESKGSVRKITKHQHHLFLTLSDALADKKMKLKGQSNKNSLIKKDK